MRAFGWRADRKGVGRLWHCAECGRLCIAQVVGSPGGDFTATANDVLASLQCHSAEAGWRTWALYDLLTQVPADYALKGQPQLMNVYLQLGVPAGAVPGHSSAWSSGASPTCSFGGRTWTSGTGARTARWSRRCATSRQEAEAQGHPALRLTGRRGGVPVLGGAGAAAGGQTAAARRPTSPPSSGSARKATRSRWCRASAAGPSRTWCGRSSGAPHVTDGDAATLPAAGPEADPAARRDAGPAARAQPRRHLGAARGRRRRASPSG